MVDETLRFVHIADKLASWGMSQRVQNIKESQGAVKPLNLSQFHDFILYVLRLGAIKMESLNRVDQKLLDRQEKSFVQYREIKQFSRKLNGDHSVVFVGGLPDVWNIRSDHDEVKAFE